MAGYGFFGSLSPFLKKWLESRGDTSWSADKIASGEAPGGVDMFNTAYDEYSRLQSQQFQMDMYREDRAWQEDMYERYQSIGGQIDQMRQNGINPAMMYANGAVNAPAVSSGQMPSSPSGSGAIAGRAVRNQTALDKASGIFQMIAGFLGAGSNIGQSLSQINRNSHMNDKDDAQAELFRKQAFIAENEGKIKEIEATYAEQRTILELNGIKFDNDLRQANWSKIWSDIDLNNSIIELNGKKYDFLDFQSSYFRQLTSESAQRTSLLVQQTALAEIDAQKQRILLPYAEQMAKAQLELTSAQGEEAKARAQLAFDEACKVYLDNVVQAGLIDRGYIDEKMKQMEKQTKGMTAQNVNTWFNSIATGIEAGCRLAGTIATGGVAGALPSGTPSAKVPTLYGADGKTPMSWLSY